MLNRIIRKALSIELDGYESRIAALQRELESVRAELARSREQNSALKGRIDYLQDRLLNYHANRWNAIDKLADYLVGTQIPGDYLEFGVYLGTTFRYAYKILSPLFSEMKFVALDSFEGLPRPQGVDTKDNYTSGFFEGQFKCSEEEFVEFLKKEGIDRDKVKIIKGWFQDTLGPERAHTHALDKIAAAWVDCDLYESTVPILGFITNRVSTGSVILFDDWHCFRNLPDLGQQRACSEWLKSNSHIALHELFSFGFHGQAFTVEVKKN
jgi:O-methyltransferase